MIRDVVNYYNEVTKNYNDMRAELEDAENLLKERAVAPEVVDNIKQMVEPIKLNYETLSYFMFLLNKPAKKDKQKRYASQNKKLISASGDRTAEKVIKENKTALAGLKKVKEDLV